LTGVWGNDGDSPMHRNVRILILIRCAPEVMLVSPLSWRSWSLAPMTRNRRSIPCADNWLNGSASLAKWRNGHSPFRAGDDRAG
jgi:hypothetical protein